MLEAMNRFVAEKGIAPVIDRTFPLADAVAALKHLESGSHFGKIVVTV
jgi:NADPH:quinone reductase-like Zn-dependent oxidoreductase